MPFQWSHVPALVRMYHYQDTYVMNSFLHEQGCFSLRMRAPLGLPLSLHTLWNFVRHMESCAPGSVIPDGFRLPSPISEAGNM